MRSIQLSLSTIFIFAVMGCTEPSPKKADSKTGDFDVLAPKIQGEVKESDYLNGKEFCRQYRQVTDKEMGRYIRVPRNYSLPRGGDFEIYAWTLRPFDPSLPTVVKVDGGPGQNTHGFPSYFSKGWNEIQFDQRGLGCSAPPTFYEYKNPTYYSTLNIILDMEEIRKAYGISKWSVYGISYGTVPATQYSSRFPDVTKAVVLEGTVFSAVEIHDSSWKAEKLNLVLDRLSAAQRKGFGHVLKSKYSPIVEQFINAMFFQNEGMDLNYRFISNLVTGEQSYDKGLLKQVYGYLKESSYDDRYQQQPGTVDMQIHRVIYCKELDGATNRASLDYDFQQGRFIVRSSSEEIYKKDCESRGVTAADQVSYHASNFPIQVPVVYFQGSHDGATLAYGALKHIWSVPKGKVSFMLAKKGGHNPMSVNVRDGSSSNKKAVFESLFDTALRGEGIDQNLLDRVNSTGGLQWTLYSNPRDSYEAVGQLSGIVDFNPFKAKNLPVAN